MREKISFTDRRRPPKDTSQWENRYWIWENSLCYGSIYPGNLLPFGNGSEHIVRYKRQPLHGIGLRESKTACTRFHCERRIAENNHPNRSRTHKRGPTSGTTGKPLQLVTVVPQIETKFYFFLSYTLVFAIALQR
jgi:hypothetical protein